MKAAFLETTGIPTSCDMATLPTPAANAGGKYPIRVAAAALNPLDTYIRAGIVNMPLPKPFITGSDVAGTVEAVGPGVKKIPGRRPRLGLEPGLAGPARDLRGICLRLGGMVLPDSRRRGGG